MWSGRSHFSYVGDVRAGMFSKDLHSLFGRSLHSRINGTDVQA